MRQLACGVVLIGSLMAVAAPAQQSKPAPEGSDLTQLSLEELMDVEIVYSASRREQRVREAPSQVFIVTAAEIRQYGYRTLAEILRAIPGFYTTYDRNYVYLGVRGFGRPGDYNSRVLVLVDGHRTNDNVYDSALIEAGFVVDLDMIERLEVIRGPSSSVYGTGAFFPVLVNVITRRGPKVGTEISASAASFDTYSGRVSFGDRFANGLEVTLSASLYDSRGQNLFFPEFDTPETNHGVAVHADDERAYHLLANVSLGEFRLQVADVSRDKGIPTASFGTVFNDRRTRTRDEQAYLDLEWSHAAGPDLNVVARTRYDRSYYHGDYIYDYPPVTTNRDLSRGESLGFEASANYSGFSRQTFSFGTEIQRNLRQDQQNFDIDPPFSYLDVHDTSTRWGVWLEDEIRLSRGLILNGGVRYDRFRSQTRLSPRVALVASPGQATDVKLIYGRSSRPPNEYESVYETTNPVQKANPGLTPETIDTFEAVVDQKLSRNLRLSVSAFLSRIQGLISLVEDPADGSVQFQNADTVDSRGAEIGLNGKWESGIAARASYSYQKVRNVATGGPLTNSPRQLAKLNVAAPLLKDDLTAGFELQYTSARLTLLGNEAGGYAIANATLLSRSLGSHFDLWATVYNLFGRNYADPGAPEHRQDVIPQDGRSFRVKLTYRF